MKRRSKYRNVPTVAHGREFDSRKEARRASELILMERAGKIRGLEFQVSYALTVNGAKIGTYTADFVYTDERGREVVEDVKSKATMTTAYRLRKRLMRAIHGIEIQEV